MSDRYLGASSTTNVRSTEEPRTPRTSSETALHRLMEVIRQRTTIEPRHRPAILASLRAYRRAVEAEARAAAEPGVASPAPLDVERLARIRDLQPKAVEYIRHHGFVFDRVGPLADDADDVTRWKVLAFSLYTDVVEASVEAEHIIERLAPEGPSR